MWKFFHILQNSAQLLLQGQSLCRFLELFPQVWAECHSLLLASAQPRFILAKPPCSELRRSRPCYRPWSCQRFWAPRESYCDPCIISWAPCGGWIQTIFLAGGLARRQNSIITPCRRHYRGIYIPEGDSRAPHSFQWCGSLEPPKISGS